MYVVFSSTLKLADEVKTGAVVSTTFTVMVADPAFPDASVAVYVIVYPSRTVPVSTQLSPVWFKNVSVQLATT